MQTSLFSSTYRGLACCTSPEQASVYLDLISEELKFQASGAWVLWLAGQHRDNFMGLRQL